MASPGATLDHPSLNDARYAARRAELAALAAGPGRRPAYIHYTAEEHGTWGEARAALAPQLARYACSEILAAQAELAFDDDHVEQLDAVSQRLEPLTGFRYEAVPGLVDKETFFGALARRRFLSTQYVRHPDAPLYTPEPDVIHEVLGHASCLAVSQLAELHRLAGEAVSRAASPQLRQLISDVFWFSAEFGVVREHGEWKAYGAGFLSSFGELQWFSTNAQILALDPQRMGSTTYDIHHYQPVLFGAESLDHVLEVVGGFFAGT